MNVISLFAGIGGICQGFKNAGFNVIWANELDKDACKTYKINHIETELIEKDINDLNIDEIPDCDILTAGFPCQAFSISGKQLGFKDFRGSLFFSIMNIVNKKQNKPKILFLENVKNLIFHDNGNTFDIIKNELNLAGYKIKYKILNTKDFGIPQNRQRLFIICFLNQCDYDNFDFSLLNTKPSLKIEEMLEENIEDKFYYKQTHKICNLLKNNLKDTNKIYQYRRNYIRENKNGLCPTLMANMGTGGHNVPLIIDYKGIRKLTQRECLNFQGFSKNFNFPLDISDSKKYKQIGNSVSINIVTEIANNLFYILGEKNV